MNLASSTSDLQVARSQEHATTPSQKEKGNHDAAFITYIIHVFPSSLEYLSHDTS